MQDSDEEADIVGTGDNGNGGGGRDEDGEDAAIRDNNKSSSNNIITVRPPPDVKRTKNKKKGKKKKKQITTESDEEWEELRARGKLPEGISPREPVTAAFDVGGLQEEQERTQVDGVERGEDAEAPEEDASAAQQKKKRMRRRPESATSPARHHHHRRRRHSRSASPAALSLENDGGKLDGRLPPPLPPSPAPSPPPRGPFGVHIKHLRPDIPPSQPRSSQAGDHHQDHRHHAEPSSERHRRKKKKKRSMSRRLEKEGHDDYDPSKGGEEEEEDDGGKARKRSTTKSLVTPANLEQPLAMAGAEIDDNDSDDEEIEPEQYFVENPKDYVRRDFSDESVSRTITDPSQERGHDTVMYISPRDINYAKPNESNGAARPPAAANRFAANKRGFRTLGSGNKVSPAVAGGADSAELERASLISGSQSSGRVLEAKEERLGSMSDFEFGAHDVIGGGRGGGGGDGRILDQSIGSGVSDDVFIASFRAAGGGGGGGKGRDVTSASTRHEQSISLELDGSSHRAPTQSSRRVEPFAGADGDGLKRSDSSEVLNLTLHQCARDGDEYNMKILLRHMGSHVKKRINQYDEDDLTPLHYAARYNFLTVVKLLVENGADVNSQGEDDVTPLHHAARYRREKKKKDASSEPNRDEDESEDAITEPVIGLQGVPLLDHYESEFGQTQESVIDYLISKGAEVNARDVYGQTPLHFAAMRGNEFAAKDLLQIPSVDIEAQDKQGISPLHMAALHNQAEVAEMLIEAGANLRCVDAEQCTPLHHAAAEGNVQMVQDLFDAGAKTPEAWVMISNMVNDQNIEGSTCLHVAVANGHYEVAKMCLEKRAEVNKSCNHYMYPLHLAATSGDIRIVQLLVENSARIDVVNDEQATALHRAATFNHVKVVRYLVEKGARINRRDKDNYTPMLLAATYGHVETIELLLQKGADYTAVDKYDRTAIYMAAEENKLPVLEKLLSYPEVKRLINVSDQYDATPLHIAAQLGHLDIVKVLLKHGAAPDSKNEEEQSPIHLAAKFGRTNIVREIIRSEKGGLHHEDENSNTALHLAAQFGHFKVVEVLLDLGSDVSARNYNQWTPLDLAASKGHTKTCSILLENDAPVDPTDKNSTTPLHLAARFGHPRAVELLLDWDADVTLEDSEGRNCLDIAIENSHADVAMGIINSDVWQEALRNSTEDPETGRMDTPMRKLIKRMPDVAERCFDRCLSFGQEKNPERPSFEVTFNYEFLDDAYMPWISAKYRKSLRDDSSSTYSDASSVGSAFDDDDNLLPSAKLYSSDSNYVKRNSPLYIMMSSEREILMDHPLVTSLLKHKWSSFGRVFYYLSLFIYCIFLTFLTAYIVNTPPPQSFNASDRVMIEDGNCDNLYNSYSQGLLAEMGTYIIISLAAFNLCKEIMQMYQAKLSYLGWINLIEWLTYVSALLLVISFNSCQRSTGYRYEWQWSLGAVSVFLAWINLVLFIQKFPQLGIYVVMFSDVLYTFAHFFVVFFLFIIAFALAFYTVLQQQDPFSSVSKSLIKTSVMMIGEFDFDTIFNDSSNEIIYSAVSYIIFIAFLVVMSILLMNLLVGLAVDDIKAVLDKAALKRMAMQVELALDVERVIPAFLRKKAFVKKKTIRPNRRYSNPLAQFFLSRSDVTTKELQRHLNYELNEMEKVQESQEKLTTDVKKLERSVIILRESSQRVESMLKVVLRSSNIDWEDEDYQEEDEVEQIESGRNY